MRLDRHHRLLFLALAGAVLLSSATAPGRSQSPSPQTPAAVPRPSKPDIRKAKKAFALGLEAEQSEDWLAAFGAYEEALRYAPGNSDALLHRELARFQMVQQRTDRAEREALAGRMEQARAELREALRLDPNYSPARERLAQFEQEAPQVPPAQSFAGELIRLQPQPGLRGLNIRGDTRSAYEAIAQQFGLVASLDADLPTRPVRLQVAAVDFETAMKLVAGQTGTFWRPLDSHTFFVAANTPEKRRVYAPVVVRTVVLSAATTPDRMTEILRLLREIAGVTHIELDSRSRTITLRDTPENVALAAALVEELEQAPGEIMMEIEILEVDRDVARRLGVTPPSSAKLITINPA
ncbi:MAG TPA: hypothetical protein VHM88_05590, partial [Candidatus Acidoferrales bacterium]|nr:hypothetical protein [Candidatus Acidoferrales bacterium]